MSRRLGIRLGAVVIGVLVVSSGALACGAAEKAKDTVIMKAAIGTWICREQIESGEGLGYDITVRADGTYRLIEVNRRPGRSNTPSEPLHGRWSVKKGQLSITLDRNDDAEATVPTSIYTVSNFTDLTPDSDHLTVDLNWDVAQITLEADVDVADLSTFTMTARSMTQRSVKNEDGATDLTDDHSNPWTCEKAARS